MFQKHSLRLTKKSFTSLITIYFSQLSMYCGLVVSLWKVKALVEAKTVMGI